MVVSLKNLLDNILCNYIYERQTLFSSRLNERFPKFNFRIQETLIIGQEEFDRLIHENDLHWILNSKLIDTEIAKHFLKSDLANNIVKSLKNV